jgi:lipopolysaccharide transport system ATP-binding protein
MEGGRGGVNPVAIEVRDVSKRFRLAGHGTTLKSAVVDLVRGRRRVARELFEALHHVDLTVEEGRMLGVIGRNGSGKSTLLKIIGGIYRPDSGTVSVKGRIGALIELGAGFHPEFTGRENIIINGILLGLSRVEVLRRLEEIVRFADLGPFIDERARTYSSGMYVRLGFSVAAHLDPDVLLIDEVLAVGDEAFGQKCAERLSDFKRRGKTMVLVTHDPLAVERWCDQAVWLDQGVVRAIGPPREVLESYHRALGKREAAAPAQVLEAGAGRELQVEDVRLLNAHGQERSMYESGETFRVRMKYRVHQAVDGVVLGFAIVRGDGLCVYGTDTSVAGVAMPDLRSTGVVEATIERLDLAAGSYLVEVTAQGRDGAPYDRHAGRYPFWVQSRSQERGVVTLRHRWCVRPD